MDSGWWAYITEKFGLINWICFRVVVVIVNLLWNRGKWLYAWHALSWFSFEVCGQNKKAWLHEQRKKNTSSYRNVGVEMQREVVKGSLRKKWRWEQFGVCFEKLIGHKKKKKGKIVWYVIELPVQFHHILFKKHRSPRFFLGLPTLKKLYDFNILYKAIERASL